VAPAFPSAMGFDHAIIAIRMSPASHSSAEHPQLGSLVFFDPTDPYVRLGYLPAELQGNYGLIVGRSGGELIRLPLTAAQINSLSRAARFELTADGDLRGEIQESRTGAQASEFRGAWLNLSDAERTKRVRDFFGRQIAGLQLKNISVKNLDTPGSEPSLGYNFTIPRYATPAGDLLLVRPRVLGEWADETLASGTREQPIEFAAPFVRVENIEIALPEGYLADEIPPATSIDVGIASYNSKIEVEGRVLRYARQLEVKDVLVSVNRLPELRTFLRQIAVDERAKVVLKKR